MPLAIASHEFIFCNQTVSNKFLLPGPHPSILRRDSDREPVEIVSNPDLAGQPAVGLAPVGESEDDLLLFLDWRQAARPILGDIDVASAAAGFAAADRLDLARFADVEHQRAAGLRFDGRRFAV